MCDLPPGGGRKANRMNWSAAAWSSRACTLFGREHRLGRRLGRLQVRSATQEARARVPSQNGIVIARRAQRLRLFVVAHRLQDQTVHRLARAVIAMPEQRERASFVHNAK